MFLLYERLLLHKLHLIIMVIDHMSVLRSAERLVFSPGLSFNHLYFHFTPTLVEVVFHQRLEWHTEVVLTINSVMFLMQMAALNCH